MSNVFKQYIKHFYPISIRFLLLDHEDPVFIDIIPENTKIFQLSHIGQDD
jgi:hypothetical protein